MATNYGKPFEQKFRSDWLKIPNSTIDRLYDVTMGYKRVKQVCDYIGYVYPNIFYLEAKSTHGNTFNFNKLTQYKSLVEKVGIVGARVGVVIWFVDHSKVVYAPIATITKMKADGKKSINIRDLEGYNIKEIPSVKKRVFCDSDYSVLLKLEDGE